MTQHTQGDVMFQAVIVQTVTVILRSLLITACLVAGALAGEPVPADPVKFQIEEQPLGDALAEFARQSDREILFSTEVVEDKDAPLVVGEYEPEDALELLLADTGLEYSVTPNDTILVAEGEGGPDSGNGRGALSQGRMAQASGEERKNKKREEGSATAQKQDSTTLVIEEILVTAQKRSDRLSEVPVPVTVVQAEKLVQSNELRLQDYYRKVPGLSLVVSDGGAPVVAIRGIATGGNTSPTVGMLVDDVPYGATVTPATAPSVPDIDPGDISQIEVLRGPQGTLYGASSMGGLIKYVTIDPSPDAFSGYVRAAATNVRYGDVGYELRGAVNTPLADTVAVRASGFSVLDTGYIDNVLTGEKNVNDRTNDGGRVSLMWEPSTDFSIKLNAIVQSSHRDGGADINVALGEGLKQSYLLGSGDYDRDLQAYSAAIKYDLGGAELTSVSGYTIDETGVSFDVTAGFTSFAQNNFGVTGVAAPQVRRVEKFSQELRAAIPLSDRVNWLVGVFYTDEQIQTRTDYLAVEATTASVAGRLLTIASPSMFREYAGFTSLTVEFTDRFDVQIGGRYSENRQTFSTVRDGPLSSIFFGADPSIIAELNAEDHSFTYLMTPRFRVSRDFMVYARLASGYRPGGPNGVCGIVGIPCTFGPDRTQNYEVGAKGSALDGAVSFDASAYYIDWKDIQLSLTNRSPVVGYQDNASRARSKGAELTVVAKPAAGLDLTGWVAFNDAELTEALPNSNTVIGSEGDRLPYSSRFSASLSVDQSIPLSEAVSANIGASLSYVGERRGRFLASVERATLPDYTQMDLRVRLHMGEWALDAFVTNLFDERGILSEGFETALGGTVFTYIQPRAVGLSLSRRF